MNPAVPIVKDLVLIGGGHSHVAVLRRFGMEPLAGARITLVGRDTDTPYSGMLPGLLANHYDFDDIHIDLRRLAGFAGARFYRDSVVGIDLENRLVLCAERPPVPFDVLSMNTGSTPSTVPGVAEHAIPVKPISRFYSHWMDLIDRAARASERLRIAVVGGGAGGVEVLLAAHHRLSRAPRSVEFHLVDRGADVLESHHARVRARFRRIFDERGIEVHLGRAVARVEAGAVVFDDGEALPADEILWCTAAGAPRWPAGSGLATDARGFVEVDACLQSTSHPGVFAAGDVASVVGHPRPKSGVFAVRQGPPLADNLRRALLGRPLAPFSPQKNFLSLITTGDKHAVLSRGGLSTDGERIWRLKDRIDRRFMRTFTDLPAMEPPRHASPTEGLADADTLAQLGDATMRCGGCGAKVGATPLRRALARLPAVAGSVAGGQVRIGLASPDDAAIVDTGGESLSIHTIDGFRAMLDDPFTFGRITANHCLGDIYAMGGTPSTATAWATVPHGLEAKVERDLGDLLEGAARELADASCALVGGHTSEGAELALGLAVQGLLPRDREPLRKSGARPGDALVLTKALGVGALLAADMRGHARGRWIDHAIECMLRSSRAAADILREHGATAATDVTGFGLLGHLVELVDASECGAELELDYVPLLPGVAEVLGAGIASSLQPANLRLRRAVANPDAFADDPRFAALFDPQTAGGLLAAIPADQVQPCLAALHDAGYRSVGRIGYATDRTEGEPAVRIRRGALAPAV